MRVLVCGSRTLKSDWLPFRVLDAFADLTTVVIHGGARGADAMADRWARMRYLCIERYPANWDTDGKAAGPIRNKRMLSEGRPEMVIAFTDKPLAESVGTAHMVYIARQAGVETLVIEHVVP
jgi:hypothetical protein